MELVGLKNELRHLLVIAQQLEPYIRSISSLMERIQPQVGGTQEQEQQREEEDGEEEQEEEEDEVGSEHLESPGPSRTSTLEYNKVGQDGFTSRQTEDERILALLDRIQTMKPEYKHRYDGHVVYLVRNSPSGIRNLVRNKCFNFESFGSEF